MRKNSTIITTFCALLALFSMVVYSACTKPEVTTGIDPCEGITCQNNGTCFSGKCSCSDGYTGEFCEKKANTPYIGRWNVTQTISSSKDGSLVGSTKYYAVTISEQPSSVTLLKVKGINGDTAYTATIRIGMTNGTVEVDGKIVEADIQSASLNYVFKRYEPLGTTGMQILRGKGNVNELGTRLSGEYYLTYINQQLGVMEDKVTFTATFAN